MKLQDFYHKKIAILGYGVEGQAIAEYLDKAGISFDVLDRKDDPNYLANLKNYDIVFRSPGVPVLLPQIVQASAAGVQITSQIKYFFDNCPAKIIGVTGTKGKGTTSRLLYEILSAQFPGQIYLGGNIGSGVLELLDKLTAKDWVVLELSSFQLQDLQASAHIAVVLMVTSEHLDYHQDRAEYIQAKTSITRFQTAKDLAVINIDFEASAEIGKLGHAQKYYVHTADHDLQIDQGIQANKKTGYIELIENGLAKVIANVQEFQLAGYHNIQNICAALQASILAGAGLDSALQIAKKFRGLEHRLEFVAEVNGIKFYNDSIGTTPDSAIAAAEAFDQPEIIILGGHDKKGDYQMMAEQLAGKSNLKALILIGEIAPQLQKYFEDFGTTARIFSGAKNMTEAFEQIRSCAERGDVVLLAPGTSSFDWYKNYKERGDEFKKLGLNF